MEVYDNLPNKISINEHWLILKDKQTLKNGLYSYRCIIRRACSFTINISKEEADNHNKDNNYKMKYNITSKININA